MGKLTVKDNHIEILDSIVAQHGIDSIKNYLTNYKKKQRKKQIRGNNYIDITFKVYRLMAKGGYSKTKAMERVADENNLSPNTVRNHCANFDKEHIKGNSFNYVKFAREVSDEMYMLQVIGKYNISEKIGRIYFYKYKTLSEKDISKYEFLYELEYPPRDEIDENEIPF